jgi:hypothetical protein
MMGRLKSDQGQLFYRFDLNDAVPEDHLVRMIDAALDLSWLRNELARLRRLPARGLFHPVLLLRKLKPQQLQHRTGWTTY